MLKVAALMSLFAAVALTACSKDESAREDESGAKIGAVDGTYTANGVSFDMVGVEGGATTLNGSAVTLTPFAIGKHEVTQGLWESVMAAAAYTDLVRVTAYLDSVMAANPNPAAIDSVTKVAIDSVTKVVACLDSAMRAAAYPGGAGYAPDSTRGKGVSHPVYYVSWSDIVGTSGSVGYTLNGVSYRTDGFCYKLSQLVGGEKRFRLPTEAEWEYAAQGGQQTHSYTYSGSNAIGDVAWYEGNAKDTSHVVGTKLANELGIHDMSGNVWEWCSDRYGSTYPSGASNPTGATSGPQASYRVVRDGGYTTDSLRCRVAYRGSLPPDDRGGAFGFRVLLP
jgi:formylglycine-generating enzyme required for sulfatase activity